MKVKEADVEAQVPQRQERELHPAEKASVLSFYTLRWLTPLIGLGATRPLEFKDLPQVPMSMTAKEVGEKLEKELAVQLAKSEALKGNKSRGKNAQFLRALFKCFWKEWFLAAFWLLVYVSGMVLSPLMVQALLEVLNEPDSYAQDPFLGIRTPGGVVAGLICALLLSVFGGNIGFMILCTLGTRMRAGVMYVLFQKSLRMSKTVSQLNSSGEIVNLMSNDSERLFFCLLTSHMLWISPSIIVIIMGLLLAEVGLPALAGLAVIVVIIPLQIKLGKEIGRQKRNMLAITDLRVGVTAEALSGINVIKMNAWEPQMSSRIQEERYKEMKKGRRVLYLFTTNTWLLFIAPNLVALAIFTAIELSSSRELTLVTVFSVLALVNALRFSFMIFPRALSALAQAIVSTERINNFLSLREIDYKDIAETFASSSHDDKGNPEKDLILYIQDGSFTWDDTSEKVAKVPRPCLTDINLHCTRGELVAVVGRVGSGKSSLLGAILNEIGKLSGTVRVNLKSTANQSGGVALGTSSFADLKDAGETIRQGIAYVSQEPWIQNATMRENVLFRSAQAVSSLVELEDTDSAKALGIEEIDEDLLNRCVEATELLPDIQILPNGIDTEIGDRGVNLSGGQKSRVAIARALYRTLRHDLELVLMDDCFSALDPHVGLRVFERLLLDLLKTRTRIVVLNSQMHLLQKFDRIIALDDGKIVLNEKTDVALQNPLLANLVALQAAEEGEDDIERVDSKRSEPEENTLANNASGARVSFAKEETRDDDIKEAEEEGGEEQDGDHEAASTSAESVSSSADNEMSRRERGKLYKEENRKRGKLSSSMYATWVKSSVPPAFVLPTVLLLVSLFALGQLFKVAAEYWLGVWSSEELEMEVGLGVFGGLIAGMTLFVLLRGIFFMFVASRSSVSLHNQLIDNILRAPINLFFDVTPAGRIINRISHDLDKVDQFLPETFFNFLSNIFQVVSALVLCILASAYFLAFLIPAIIIFILLGRYFSRTSRELKRMESISRSPLYSNFSETIAGLSTVRAFAIENDLMHKHEFLVDNNGRAFFLFWMAARWFALRLDFLVALLQSSVALLAVLTWDSVDPKLMALAIIYAIQLTGMLQFTVRLSVETENAFTSVERLSHYATSIPQEKEPNETTALVAKTWPDRGAIEFRNVSLRYRPNLDIVLHNISFSIQAGEKVGICGRSGAGKTSISSALFRLVDPLETGKILIDGVDISTISLASLRVQLGIIPQQPVIFSGTLRFNLDPWSKYKDDAILEAMDRVQLGRLGREGDGLDMELYDKGSNLSVGERQLISIARSVLRGARIIMADEATANIDSATDALIQQTIRQEFKTQTLLTIAHRMQTIADSDKILVLSYGRVVEFDSPANLLANPASMYASMLNDSQRKQSISH